MFWGLIMEPNKRYTQVVEKPFHISQAAIDVSTGDNEPCQVMVMVDSKNFLVCTLQKKVNVQVPLDLYFTSGESISFLINGKCNIHLTGYLDPEFDEEPTDEEASDDEEEAPELVPSVASSKGKRKLQNGDAPLSKKAKKAKPASSDSSDEDDDDDQLQKLLDGADLETDENDSTFNANTSMEATSDDSDEDEEDEDEEEVEEDDEDEEEEKDSDEEEKKKETLKKNKEQESPVDMSKLSKNQRRKLKKKLKEQGMSPQMNGIEKPKKQQDGKQQKENKQKEDGAGDKREKKILSGGVQIEDVKVGNGPVAKPGKTVAVFYEGRLKQNNKMFDNCSKGPGFKFRLGAKEVISGWDVGVAGMKVGGKRKIVCPPAMAYGAKGSPPVIPPNSTLVFEVELKNVK